jgi:hypothetical protein
MDYYIEKMRALLKTREPFGNHIEADIILTNVILTLSRRGDERDETYKKAQELIALYEELDKWYS